MRTLLYKIRNEYGQLAEIQILQVDGQQFNQECSRLRLRITDIVERPVTSDFIDILGAFVHETSDED